MHDPDHDRDRRRHAVDERGGPLRLDRRGMLEIGVPDDTARDEQRRHEQRHRPEDELLPGVEASDFGNMLLVVPQDGADCLHPFDVVAARQVVAPELRDHPDVADEQYAADPRMCSTHPLPAAEQPVEEVEHRRNIARPETISSTKQAAVIQWLTLAAAVLRMKVPRGWVISDLPRHG